MNNGFTSSDNNGVRATAPFSFQIPAPERINIPPPTITEHGEPGLRVGRVVCPPGVDDLAFLRDIDCNHLYNNDVALSSRWAYDRRREASQILPWLFLGPMTAARDRELLRRDGITMVLGIAHRSATPSRMITGPQRAAEELGLESGVIEVADNRELIAAFPRATQKINQHLVRVHKQAIPHPTNTIVTDYGRRLSGKVLVYCESGNERSAAVVAAYLVQMLEDTDHVKACQMCSLRRFSCNLDDGLKHCLMSYYDIVRAQRDVSGAPGPAGVNGLNPFNHKDLVARRKRSFTDQHEDFDGMSDDAARFSGRDFTPFQDEIGHGP